MNRDFEDRVNDVKRRAHGQWTPLLRSMGVSESILSGKNQPCPIDNCGGTDRFQYTDKYGEGDFFCRAHGHGAGFKLLMGVLHLPFSQLIEDIERKLGSIVAPSQPTAQGPSPERMKQLCQKIWEESRPVVVGDEVDRYLRNRCLQQAGGYPRSLRFHPKLGYYEKKVGQARSKKIGEYAAMIACVQGPDGHAVTLHRTYLKDGYKALGRESKKVLSSGINGAAVRLGEPTTELAITEGIETGLAVLVSTGKPVWAALNCGNLERVWIPDTVEKVCIYGDNDADAEFAGQKSAFTLANSLVRDAKKRNLKRSVQVFVPLRPGADWADVRLARIANSAQAA